MLICNDHMVLMRTTNSQNDDVDQQLKTMTNGYNDETLGDQVRRRTL